MGGPGSGRRKGAGISGHMKNLLNHARRYRETNPSRIKTLSKSNKMKYFKTGKRAGVG